MILMAEQSTLNLIMKMKNIYFKQMYKHVLVDLLYQQQKNFSSIIKGTVAEKHHIYCKK